MTPSSRPKSGSGTLTPARRGVFWTATALTPCIVLVTLELLLRLAHYGPDVTLFRSVQIGTHRYRVMNPGVAARYFSRIDFHPATSVDLFEVPKPQGMFRIFCLGGSTTAGFPYGYIGSFPAFLRDRLHAVFPDRPVEVINLGMTAANSFATLDIAREVLDEDPDLLVVYDGHNEFYGALGVASNASAGSSRGITELYLALVRFRTFVLLRTLYDRLEGVFAGPATPPPSGTMMEILARGQYIPLGSPEYRNALRIFCENLDAMTVMATERRVPVILASQVSNLRDQPPFISVDDPEGTPQTRLAFATAFNGGLSDFMDGRFREALASCRRASAGDPGRADAHYEVARCLDTLVARREAEQEYIRARDLDQLRFRASSDFNSAIRSCAAAHGAIFVDIERDFRDSSSDSLIGSSLILEHLHPNARGSFLMARAFARAMRDHGLLATAAEWSARDTIPDVSLWNQRHLTELDELCANRRIEILTSGWPFRPNDGKIAPPGSDSLSTIAERMVTGGESWKEGHQDAVEYYRRIGDTARLRQECSALLSQFPHDFFLTPTRDLHHTSLDRTE